MATRVCAKSELGLGEAIRVMVDGVAIALVIDSVGNCFALGDMCSHADISLSDGFVEGDELECWAHGGRFELSTGRARTLPASEPVPVYQVTIVDGDVYVDVNNQVDMSAYRASS
ncbi:MULTISPECIES: non-heme iron oxygenase ferredoxin subunit [Cryobacterium]|uniref:non-heme iron oxygenase ferredoxin subunit n=1 Tax=Cryobacterium TaxID=69578 RepID=UPI002411853D|nr:MULTISPECIES: non-heme iron oxygenase ferredoxin subunit [Cryobacterium]